MGASGYQPRRRKRIERPPVPSDRVIRERCDCGKAVYHGPGEARAGMRSLSRAGRDNGGRMHVYRCTRRPGIWHVGHN